MPDSMGIIVLGPYRSGTSVTAQVLHALGVNFGPKRYLIPAHDWNPGGMYERIDINDANDALIRSAGKTLADPGDPNLLVEKGDRESFKLADMSWMQRGNLWGVKDPRLCLTLLAWLEAGIFDRKRLKIIHVRRGIEAAVRSAMLCPPVRNFCDGTETGAARMLNKYAEMAQWHVDTLDIPAISFDYERLIKQPLEVVAEMAQFIGVNDPKVIRKATRIIGKGNGRLNLQLERLFIRGPIRAFRFLTGRGPLLR
jgi:hypothetical protein